MLKEFKEFAMRGSVVDMAVGIVIGGAFATIVKSLVSDVIMPPVGVVVSGVDFSDLFLILKEGTAAGPYVSLDAARAAGAVTLNYGVFFNALVSFLIVALAAFLLIKALNRLVREGDTPGGDRSTRECPRCCSAIAVRASRCPCCTSDLAPVS